MIAPVSPSGKDTSLTRDAGGYPEKTWGDGSQMMVVWEETSGRLIVAQDRGCISYEFHGQAEKRDCLSGDFLL